MAGSGKSPIPTVKILKGVQLFVMTRYRLQSWGRQMK